MTAHIDVGIVVALITIIGTFLAVGRWLYKQFRSLENLLEDWHGEAPRPGVPGRGGGGGWEGGARRLLLLMLSTGRAPLSLESASGR